MSDPSSPARVDPAGPIDSKTPTSPHLSRLVWLGEQLVSTADELAALFPHDGIERDLNPTEFTALRTAAQQARTAGGDVVLLASAAHHRAQQRDQVPDHGGA